VKGEGRSGPRISLIVAVARNGVIGKDGKLPWHLPEDLKRFKALTMGHHIIMGRRTWESIGRPLPGRTSVVVSRQRDYSAPGATLVHSFAEAVAACAGDDEAFVIGGEEIYRTALPAADRIYLTQLDAEYAGATRFPALTPGEWREVSCERHPASGPERSGFDFVVLEREPGVRRRKPSSPTAAHQ
jgi:dihydrofolate reductase